MKDTLIPMLPRIIVPLIIAGMVFAGFSMWLETKKTAIRYEAIDACTKISRSETQVDETNKVSYPLADVLANCLKIKGIE